MGTICHDEGSARLTKHTLGNIMYNLCRDEKFKLNGFPDYDKIMQEVEKMEAGSNGTYKQNDAISYEVCKPLADGTLVMLDALVSKFLSFGDKMAEEMGNLLVAHNAEFNNSATQSDDAKRKREADNDESQQAKKLKAEELTIEEFVANYSDAMVLTEPIGRWAASGEGGLVFENSDAKDATYPASRECFSFGSGDWLEGDDAIEEMGNGDGRWFAFSVGTSSRAVLDPAGLP